MNTNFSPTLIDGIILTMLGVILSVMAYGIKHAISSTSKRFTTQDTILTELKGGHDKLTLGVETIRVVLLGATGDNGINSEVKKLREGQDEFRRTLASLPKRKEDYAP